MGADLPYLCPLAAVNQIYWELNYQCCTVQGIAGLLMMNLDLMLIPLP